MSMRALYHSLTYSEYMYSLFDSSATLACISCVNKGTAWALQFGVKTLMTSDDG